jgi:hypothetical protein
MIPKAVGGTLAVLVLCCSACGSRIGQERLGSETTQNESQKRDEQLARLRAQHGAVDFPGSRLSAQPLTYDIQQFFAELAGKPVIFEAYIEDVEHTRDGILVEFTRIIRPSMIEDGVTVSFRLTGTHNQISIVRTQMEAQTETSRFLNSIRLLSPGDSVVVATIGNVRKVRRYEVHGTPISEEEVDLSANMPRQVIAEGRLLAVERSITNLSTETITDRK